MIIKHFVNSFVIIKNKKIRIACDPWIGKANYGGWHSYPLMDKKLVLSNLRRCKYIYISHLHSDHFCPELLQDLDLEKTHFIIKNFKLKTLKNNLTKVGIKNISEIEPFKELTLDEEYNLTIVPQFQSNSKGIDDQLSYDLDTSLIAHEIKTNQVFFHKVDNPLSIDSIKKINLYIKNKYNKNIDISTFTCGAASDWPQCFINLDRNKLKDEFIDSSIKKLLDEIKILKCKYVFLSGGGYVIPGKFFNLNKLKAVPLISQIGKAINEQTNTTLLKIVGGHSFDLDNPTNTSHDNNFDEITKVDMKKLKAMKYFHETQNISLSHENIKKSFNRAQISLEERFNFLKIKPETKVRFLTYDNLQINSKGEKMNKNFKNEYILFGNHKNINPLLTIHLDEQALISVLSGKVILKQLLSGSCALQERTPDVFFPGTIFPLAFFRDPISHK